MPRLATELFLLQLATTLFMTGLIWFVQIVHYPLFAEVGSGQLTRYETLHARRTTWVVFPPMLFELITSLAALYPPLRPGFVPASQAAALCGLVLVIWVTTAVGHVPLHTRLGREATTTAPLIGLLIRLNWIRTVAWSLRFILLLALLVNALHAWPGH